MRPGSYQELCDRPPVRQSPTTECGHFRSNGFPHTWRWAGRQPRVMPLVLKFEAPIPAMYVKKWFTIFRPPLDRNNVEESTAPVERINTLIPRVGAPRIQFGSGPGCRRLPASLGCGRDVERHPGSASNTGMGLSAPGGGVTQRRGRGARERHCEADVSGLRWAGDRELGHERRDFPLCTPADQCCLGRRDYNDRGGRHPWPVTRTFAPKPAGCKHGLRIRDPIRSITPAP